MSRSFTVSTDRIEIASGPALSFIDATNQFTICFWSKATNFTGNPVQIAMGPAGAGVTTVIASTGVARVNFSNTPITTINSSTISAGTWGHYAFTYNGLTDKKAHIFQNGIEKTYSAQTATALPVLYPGPIWIGGNNPTGNPQVGLLAEVAIFNIALTPVQVAQIASSVNGIDPTAAGFISKNLITYYHLSGQDSPEIDSTGNQNWGVVVGTAYGADSPGYSFAAGQPINTLVSGGASVPTTNDSGVVFANPA